MSSNILTPSQLHALFDILSHAETYREIEYFKDPSAASQFGYPFITQSADAANGDSLSYTAQSATPIISLLMSKFLLSLPPAKTVPPEFWNVRSQGLLTKFAEADLSESYDKGAMGTRKTLATAASAVFETLARGCLGGYPGGPVPDLGKKEYVLASADDISSAWDHVVREMVYGDLVGELFDFMSEHENLEGHSPAVQAAVQYVIVHLASFLHRVFVVSTEGQYLLKLIENVHKLLPYTLIKQTLRVSNAATTINAMMKLLLAKLSVGSVSNWLGFTKDAEDGMNLLQRIVSMVLSWDSSDFRKSAEKIEKAKDRPSDDHLGAIKTHIDRPRSYHEAIRRSSIEKRQSIVVVIFNSIDPELSKSLSESQHKQCLEYYSALLSVRDREEIAHVLCRQNPDLLTQFCKEAAAAVDPIIRQLHDKIDLREHVADGEEFMSEFIEVGKGTKVETSERDGGPKRVPPFVKDYAELLRRNTYLVYKYLHRVASQCPEIRDMFRVWAMDAIKVFRNEAEAQKSEDAESNERKGHLSAGAGTMGCHLCELFVSLPVETQRTILPILDARATYISSLYDISATRMQCTLDQLNGNTQGGPVACRMEGPGQYLARWQNLMDETLITPGEPQGELRRGRDVKHAISEGKTGANGNGKNGKNSKKSREGSPFLVAGRPEDTETTQPVEPPDARLVVEAMGPQFTALLATLVG